MTDKHDPALDEAFDALNDETFGGEEDEWEWGGDADELCPSPNQLSLDRSLASVTTTTSATRPMHSSNLMTSMSSITNVSGIRRLSDIEKSFSSIELQDDSDLPDDPAIMKFTKSPAQPLMSSLIHDHSASSDPFSSFSINPNRLSSSVWAPPDQSLFDTASIPCSLSSGSPVPPAPPSDPWKNSPKQQAYDHLSNNNNRLMNTLIGMESPGKTSSTAGPKVIPQPMSLEELEASFRSESSPAKQQQLSERKSPMPRDRPVGHPAPVMTAAETQQQQLERHLRAAEQNRLPHPIHMMPMPMHPQMGLPFPLTRPLLPPGRVNLVHHPQIQQNFLLIQQAPYRPPHQLPPHPFLNQQQMYNMQMQQRFPYHRVNYVNNNNVHMNRMPNQPHETVSRRPVDEFAGFMSQKEREWLIRIQKLQLESSITDPYVEDYYAMCYNSKKLVEAKTRDSQTAPTLVVMEPRIARGAASTDSGGNQKAPGSNYVPLQFENSLGKIQVSNIQCPRKLLDLMSLSEKRAQASDQTVSTASTNEPEPAKPLARKELTKFRKLLLEIERLYLILLKIDYEDKRMAALPDDQRQPHVEVREQLCRQLFEGITRRDDHAAGGSDVSSVRLNIQIASIRKGCALIFRSLQLLHDVHQKEVIITGLLEEENFHLIANQKDKELYSLDYLKILFEAMKSINPSLTDEELTKVSF